MAKSSKKWMNWVANETVESGPGCQLGQLGLANARAESFHKRGRNVAMLPKSPDVHFFARSVVVFWTKIVIVSILDLSCRSHLSFPSQAVLAAEKRLENPSKTHGKPIENPSKTHGKPFKNPWFGFQPLVDTQSNFRSLRSPKSLARVLLSSVDAWEIPTIHSESYDDINRSGSASLLDYLWP